MIVHPFLQGDGIIHSEPFLSNRLSIRAIPVCIPPKALGQFLGISHEILFQGFHGVGMVFEGLIDFLSHAQILEDIADSIETVSRNDILNNQ